MKLLHIADLHIGRKLKGFSLLDDQEYVLNQIIDIAKKQKAKGIIIAGDIYDTSIPNVDAINLFDKFLSDIHKLNISCYVVSGNHDNISRVSFGADILSKENIFFAQKYSGEISPINIGEGIIIWLLPFIRPADVREFHSDFSTSNYEEMMEKVIERFKLDKSKTNILVAHQFITANGKSPQRSDSETIYLGTMDNIDYSYFKDFDYVALGHIHRPQSMGRKTVRYAGSPLKYSFSEVNHKKSITLLDIKNKKVEIKEIPLLPKKDLKEFKGKFEDLIKENCEDFVHITLTDDFIPDAKNRLEGSFPYLMQLDYDNYKTQNTFKSENFEIQKQSDIYDSFRDFFEMQNGVKLNKKQKTIIGEILEEIAGDI